MESELDYHVFHAPPEERLDIAIAKMLETSRTRAKSLITEGYVQLNGKPVEKAAMRLLGNEVISVVLPPPKQAIVEPEDIPLTIIYEDDDLAVIDKPPNLTAHPTAIIRTGTVVNALLGKMALAKEKYFDLTDDDYRPGIVHRLDKDTSGAMIIAKHDKAHHNISDAFRQRLVEKEYVAIVVGDLSDDVEVDAPIGRDFDYNLKMVIGGNNPKSANTYFRGIASVRHPSLGALSLIKARPYTGRTHQIRVHLQHLGIPIWGDVLYGKHSTIMPRQALHAFSITLPHPKDNMAVTFKAEVPLDIIKAWLKVGGEWPPSKEFA